MHNHSPAPLHFKVVHETDVERAMTYRDPKCVFVADNRLHAQIVIEWLEEYGIAAQVPPEHTYPQFDLFDAALGCQVWVLNPEQTEEAARLLTVREWARVIKEEEDELSEDRIPVTCEECGGISIFLAQSRGSCQLCRHCGAYVDVGENPNEVTEEREDGHQSSESLKLPPHVRPESD
jgi:hypothetical protein